MRPSKRVKKSLKTAYSAGLSRNLCKNCSDELTMHGLDNMNQYFLRISVKTTFIKHSRCSLKFYEGRITRYKHKY